MTTSASSNRSPEERWFPPQLNETQIQVNSYAIALETLLNDADEVNEKLHDARHLCAKALEALEFDESYPM